MTWKRHIRTHGAIFRSLIVYPDAVCGSPESARRGGDGRGRGAVLACRRASHEIAGDIVL